MDPTLEDNGMDYAQPAQPEPSFGEKAVGLDFNPSGDGAVRHVKEQFARCIDLMHDLRCATKNKEIGRMASIAITETQTAQMWAVKALTWRHD